MPLLQRATDGKLLFWCPGCAGHHYFDQRWTFSGDEGAPTFAPSLLVRGACGSANIGPSAVCHSFVRSGQIEFLTDSTHPLAGQTVPMVDLDAVRVREA
jgi:hypothetical protein